MATPKILADLPADKNLDSFQVGAITNETDTKTYEDIHFHSHT